MTKPLAKVSTIDLEVWACEWEDAHWNSGEFEKDEITHRPINYITTGILLRNDETGITFASDKCETATFRGTNFIPRKMIVDTWKVGNLTKAVNRRRKSALPDQSHSQEMTSTTLGTQGP